MMRTIVRVGLSLLLILAHMSHKINLDQRELRIRSVPKDSLKRPLVNIARHLGIDLGCTAKKLLMEAISKYPEHIRNGNFLD